MSRYLFAAAVLVVATTAAAETTIADADRHFDAKEWREAVTAYEEVVKRDEKQGRAWLRLGRSRANAGDPAGAVAALAKADELGFAKPFARFYAARAFAATGDADQAFAWLDKAIEASFAAENLLADDSVLARLHPDPRWLAFVDEVRRNARPCAYIPEFRQWDFWVGRWTVTSAAGQLAGHNDIRLQANGCYLLESWKSARGTFTGQSLSYWDAPAEQWVQVWTDSTGQNIVARGDLKDGSIVLEGEFRPRTGKISGYRGTWTPLADGRVRQHLEQSTDDGETWNTWFDGYYERSAD